MYSDSTKPEANTIIEERRGGDIKNAPDGFGSATNTNNDGEPVDMR